jgi:hypothetical protein
MQCAQGEQSRGRRGGGKQPAMSCLRAGGGTEAAAVAVEEDDETKREDERGMAKQPDLNKLDVPECAELTQCIQKMEEATAAHRPALWTRDGDRQTGRAASRSERLGHGG